METSVVENNQVPSSTGFLKRFDSKMIHIGIEILALIGLVYYFSSKNKKLTSHIEELNQKIQEQEKQIQALKNDVNMIVKSMNNIPIPKMLERLDILENKPRPKLKKKVNSVKLPEPNIEIVSSSENHSKFSGTTNSVPSTFRRVDIKPSDEVSISENDDDDEVERNIDSEIAEELQELINE